MTVLQTIAVAFAMFSAVPVPQFDWNEKNMRYSLCAFPLVGVLCGALWCVCASLPLPAMVRAAGFHLFSRRKHEWTVCAKKRCRNQNFFKNVRVMHNRFNYNSADSWLNWKSDHKFSNRRKRIVRIQSPEHI